MNETNRYLDDCIAQLNLEGQRSVWVRNRAKVDYVLSKARKYVSQSKTVCEVGLGDGYLLRRLARKGLHVTGVDVSKYLIETLKMQLRTEGFGPEIELLNTDISVAALGVATFDMIFCLDVLEHVQNLAQAVSRLEKSLLPAGVLVITLPIGEILEEHKVACPECGHVFHRIGHFHSFADIRDVQKMLGANLGIEEYGEVMGGLFGRLLYPVRLIARHLRLIEPTRNCYFIVKKISH